jgi:hypothetical protein
LISSPPTTLIDKGTSLAFSVRLRAVTVMVWESSDAAAPACCAIDGFGTAAMKIAASAADATGFSLNVRVVTTVSFRGKMG